MGCDVNTVVAEALACAEVTANGSVTVLFALMVDGFPVNTSLRRVILNVTARTRREFRILSAALLHVSLIEGLRETFGPPAIGPFLCLSHS